MRYRLTGTYLALLTLVLLSLAVPLAVFAAASRTQAMIIDRNDDAARFASLADPALRTGETVTLTDELHRYFDLYGIAAAIADRDGDLVTETGDPRALDTAEVRRSVVAALAGERVGAGRTVWPWQTRPLVVAVPVTTAGEVVGAVVTLSPTGSMRADVRRTWAGLAAGGLVAGLAFALVAVALTRGILRPVAQLDEAAHRISAGALDARVVPGLGPPELRRLAQAFNTMADDVTDALQRQRDFAAQASHQMRNPLAALRLRVEELGAFIADPAGAAEHRFAVEETERLRHILDGLLALAQAERGHEQLQTVDAARVAGERVAAWQPLAQQRGITLCREGRDHAEAVAVPTAVGQALDALIDNALKFAGAGATVSVRVDAEPETITLHVIDDGPGMCDSERIRAAERFWRGPGTQNIDGSGLGLPIAAVLLSASGGRLDLLNVHPHGLHGRLTFAAAVRASSPGSTGRPRDAAATGTC